jgi:hypothetical protein
MRWRKHYLKKSSCPCHRNESVCFLWKKKMFEAHAILVTLKFNNIDFFLKSYLIHMISRKENLQEKVDNCELRFSQSVRTLLLLHKSTKNKNKKKMWRKISSRDVNTPATRCTRNLLSQPGVPSGSRSTSPHFSSPVPTSAGRCRMRSHGFPRTRHNLELLPPPYPLPFPTSHLPHRSLCSSQSA